MRGRPLSKESASRSENRAAFSFDEPQSILSKVCNVVSAPLGVILKIVPELLVPPPSVVP